MRRRRSSRGRSASSAVRSDVVSLPHRSGDVLRLLFRLGIGRAPASRLRRPTAARGRGRPRREPRRCPLSTTSSAVHQDAWCGCSRRGTPPSICRALVDAVGALPASGRRGWDTSLSRQRPPRTDSGRGRSLERGGLARRGRRVLSTVDARRWTAPLTHGRMDRSWSLRYVWLTVCRRVEIRKLRGCSSSQAGGMVTTDGALCVSSGGRGGRVRRRSLPAPRRARHCRSHVRTSAIATAVWRHSFRLDPATLDRLRSGCRTSSRRDIAAPTSTVRPSTVRRGRSGVGRCHHGATHIVWVVSAAETGRWRLDTGRVAAPSSRSATTRSLPRRGQRQHPADGTAGSRAFAWRRNPAGFGVLYLRNPSFVRSFCWKCWTRAAALDLTLRDSRDVPLGTREM